MNRNALGGILGSVVLGVAIVGGALYYDAINVATGISDELTLQRQGNQHIYGNPAARTTIVEFSDVECPFCARLHTTLKTLVDQSDGTINWEYRHLPLPMHRHAELGAVAVECVARLSASTETWKYLDALMETQGQHNQRHYSNLAAGAGISSESFIACLDDPAMQAIVAHDTAVARSFGGSGTPFNVIIYPDNTTRTVSGALPEAQWRALLGQAQ